MPETTSTSGVRLAAVACSLLLGGATTFLLNLQRALRGAPHRLRVIGVEHNLEHESDFTALGTDLHIRGPRRAIYEDRLAWSYQRLAEFSPQAVLACLGAESFEMLRLAPPGVARIGIIQSDDPIPYEMARGYAQWVDAMVGVSEGIAEKLRAIPEFQGKKIVAIPYGISFGPPAPRQIHEGPLRVVYVGRLIEEQKRISRLAEVIRQLPAADFRFTIAGSGPEEAAFRQSLEGATNVTFLGAVPNAEVSAILEKQEVSLLLSDFEGLPLSLLESMGHGVVPVLSDLAGGIREAVAEDCGLRLPVGDVAGAVAALLALAADRERVSRMAAAAATRARIYYSADTMAVRYLELIDSLKVADNPAWPARREVPPPVGLPAWKFRGLPRIARRLVRKLIP